MEIKKPFWKWVFCEADGTPSSSRVFTAVLVSFACGWVTAFEIHTGSLPEFSGLAVFISVLYGFNKASNALGQGSDQNKS